MMNKIKTKIRRGHIVKPIKANLKAVYEPDTKRYRYFGTPNTGLNRYGRRAQASKMRRK